MLILGSVVSLGLIVGSAAAQDYQAPAASPAPQAGPPAANPPPMAAQPGLAAPSEDADLAALAEAVKSTKLSLDRAIAQVATGTEVPIEAKFEIEDGKFWLSVYTSAKGLDTIAEQNEFKEYKGEAAQAEWKPETEVFKDFEHIARSAQYHTLLSMTDVTITYIIKRATTGGAVVVSVKPKVVDHKPVFEVATLANGKIVTSLFDLMTGQTTAQLDIKSPQSMHAQLPAPVGGNAGAPNANAPKY
jgi:hypothetical protein